MKTNSKSSKISTPKKDFRKIVEAENGPSAASKGKFPAL